MIDQEMMKINQTHREYAIFRLLAGGANVYDVYDIVRKLYIADKEDFTEEDIKSEVDKCHALHLQEGSGGPRRIQAEVEAWLASNKSNNLVTGVVTVSIRDCYRDLNLNSSNNRTSCRMAFKRLVEKGVIEPVPNRAGTYRSVNAVLESIDFINADTTPFPIKFPLGVHEFVQLYQKSLVVIAGEPNAGKTAYLLNTAWKNIDLEPSYFSSEMGAAELQVRLKKFPHPLSAWQRVKFYAKASDFPKVIVPDGLNIIDYLEVSKDFYEIGGLLTDIFNSLGKGVAVVGIQKPPGRDIGVGGARTLDKARLYLSIVPGEIKIIKGKLWRNDQINPNGMFCRFKLGGGANFVRDGEWRA